MGVGTGSNEYNSCLLRKPVQMCDGQGSRVQFCPAAVTRTINRITATQYLLLLALSSITEPYLECTKRPAMASVIFRRGATVSALLRGARSSGGGAAEVAGDVTAFSRMVRRDGLLAGSILAMVSLVGYVSYSVSEIYINTEMQ